MGILFLIENLNFYSNLFIDNCFLCSSSIPTEGYINQNSNMLGRILIIIIVGIIVLIFLRVISDWKNLKV